MKKRLTAYVLAMVLACSCFPVAFATESEQTIPETAESSISSLYAEAPCQKGELTAASGDDSDVYEPQILSQAEHEKMLASGECEVFTYSKNYSEGAVWSEQSGDVTTASRASGFSTYGAQLYNLRYQANGSRTKVNVGPAMKKMYDQYKADIQKGTSGKVFKYETRISESSEEWTKRSAPLRTLGVTLTIPSNYTQTQVENLAFDCGWVVYRCLDFDCPELFYSNGYCSMGYLRDPNRPSRMTIFLCPLSRKGFTTVSERKSLKTQLDSKVKEIVNGASQYTRAYDKIKYFDAWLCSHNSYNNQAGSSSNADYYADNISSAPWSSVSAILSSSNSSVKSPVCEGYSRAFQLLCNKAGIQATNVVSDSGWHMWNNLRYGNYWTGMDVTWNDSSGTKNYFCKTVNNTDGHKLDDADFYTWFTYPKLSNIANSSVLPYYDVSKNTWARPYIQNVYDKNYMVGNTCVSFGPNEKVTREQFVQILYNIAGQPAVSYQARFSDVSAGKWYTNAIMWASQNGVVSGYPNGTFGVGKTISRQDLALMLYLYKGKPQVGTVDLNARFVDAHKIYDYAYEAINWAVASGVMHGDDRGVLNPRGTATRAETATLISQAVA